MSSCRGNAFTETCWHPSTQELLLFHHHEAATPRVSEKSFTSAVGYSLSARPHFLSSHGEFEVARSASQPTPVNAVLSTFLAR